MKVPLALCAGGAAAHMPWVEMNRPALMYSNIPTTITAAFVAAVGPKIACTGYRANSIVRGKTTVATAAAPPPQGAGTELGEDERGRDRQKLAASVEAAVVAMPRRPKCAVVGGGFAGLATAYHLAASGSDVTVYDPNEVGTGGASSVAAGLLHPLTPRGKKIWKGEEGLFDAKELIEVANAALARTASTATAAAGSKSCVTTDRVYRPLMDDKNDETFSKAAIDLPQWVTRLTPEEYAEAVPGANSNCLGGVHIKGALAVDAQAYLKGLWAACCHVVTAPPQTSREEEASPGNRGGVAMWVHEHVDDVHALAASGEFHAVVACVGPGVKILPGVKDIVSLRLVRGQSLIYDNVDDSRTELSLKREEASTGGAGGGDGGAAEKPGDGGKGKLLSSAVLCGQYVVPTGVNGAVGNGGKLVVGATQEPILYHDALDKPPDMAKALRYLRPKISSFFPVLQDVEPREVTSGIRVIQDRNSYGRIPIAGRLPFSERGWVMAALGARGLIHHAYLGRLLAACALLNTDAHLPPQVMSPLEDLGKDSTGDL